MPTNVQNIRLTPVARVVDVFSFYRDSDPPDGPLKTDAYRLGVSAELRHVQTKMLILYGVTALLAFVLIGGRLPPDATVTVLATTIPVSALSLPALALLLGGLFGMYAQAFISGVLAISLLSVALRRDQREHWQIYAADTLGDMLWSSVLIADDFAFMGSGLQRAGRFLVSLISFGTVGLHVVLCVSAIVITIVRTVVEGSAFGMLLSGFGLAAALIAALCAIVCVFVPLPLKPVSSGSADGACVLPCLDVRPEEYAP